MKTNNKNELINGWKSNLFIYYYFVFHSDERKDTYKNLETKYSLLRIKG